MLIRKEAYWLSGGCDEDFVGSYGYTDPHFFQRLKHIEGIKLVTTHIEMDSMSIPPLVHMPDDIPCPDNLSCLSPYKGVKPAKDK